MSNLPPSPKAKYLELGIDPGDIDARTEQVIEEIGGEVHSVLELPQGVPHSLRKKPLYGGMVIPYAADRDKEGRPMFAVVSEKRRLEIAAKRLCGICGKKLPYPLFFIGGPRSIATEMFIDPPMHYDCAVYSLVTCPYLRFAPGQHPATLAGKKEEIIARGMKRKKPESDIQAFDLVREGRPRMMGLAVAASYEFGYIRRSMLDKPQYMFIARGIGEIAWYTGVEGR